MCYDPDGGSGLTEGGYTRCYSQSTHRCRASGLDCAGSHDIEVSNNRVVNDGSETTYVGYGMGTFQLEQQNLELGQYFRSRQFRVVYRRGRPLR